MLFDCTDSGRSPLTASPSTQCVTSPGSLHPPRVPALGSVPPLTPQPGAESPARYWEYWVYWGGGTNTGQGDSGDAGGGGPGAVGGRHGGGWGGPQRCYRGAPHRQRGAQG